MLYITPLNSLKKITVFPSPHTPSFLSLYTQPQLIVGSYQYDDIPVQIRCPCCNEDIVTELHYENGLFNWLLVGVLCCLGLFGLWCLLLWVNHACSLSCLNAQQLVHAYATAILCIFNYSIIAPSLYPFYLHVPFSCTSASKFPYPTRFLNEIKLY